YDQAAGGAAFSINRRASRQTASLQSGPLAFAEHRRASAVRIEAVNVDLVRADHPVDVDHALVAAPLCDLRGAKFGAVDKAFRVALPKRDVAGGVLVEQRVEEQKPALRDRRGMRH